MDYVDIPETVTIAGLELMRLETQVAPKNERDQVDVHENVWMLKHPRPLTDEERLKVLAWATGVGAALLGV